MRNPKILSYEGIARHYIAEEMKTNLSQLYFSYMLRFWRDDPSSTWRSSIEDPHTGERKFFPNLEALCDFVQNQMSDIETEETKKDDVSA